MPKNALSFEELLPILAKQLERVLSAERTAEDLADILVPLPRYQQDFIIKWASIAARSNAELGYQFTEHAPGAFQLMPADDVHDWLIQAMDVYDRKGLYQATTILRNAAEHAEASRRRAQGVIYQDKCGVLEKFVRGLAGRDLKLETGDLPFTDTETLYLPRQISLLETPDLNFVLYKAMATQLWAQTWFGTFQRTDFLSLEGYDDVDLALELFGFLETLRLNACIGRDLAGLYRDMMEAQAKLGGVELAGEWKQWEQQLSRPQTTVADTCKAVAALYPAPPPGAFAFQTTFDLKQVKQVMTARIETEKQSLQNELNKLVAENLPPREAEEKTDPPKIDVDMTPDIMEAGGMRMEITLDDQPVAPPAEVRNLLISIFQDFGMIPPEYLVAAGDGAYGPATGEEVRRTMSADADVIFYDEWDYRRQQYRKNWCWLKEKTVWPHQDPFVERTLKKHAGLLMNIRKTFEALRGEDKLLKRQTSGDDVDFDAVVEAYADMAHGMEMSERLFTKANRLDRNIAVMFMVDMSGSTKGWINDAERESLVLLCEALEVLGDRYAIYGFSGLTRNRCEIFHVKHFDERYSDTVKGRITGITPQDYTRMGVTIRHLSQLLNTVEARTKLLITLSDGKPDDFDGYRGDYGIEDTRQALIEAKHLGIHPFCITIDSEAHDYLPHMYGAVNYTVIDDVRKLPLKIADIYRQLTH